MTVTNYTSDEFLSVWKQNVAITFNIILNILVK